MNVIASNIKTKDITETLKGLQNMCNSVQILYETYAKGNTELTNLANISFYLLWNYSKSMIELIILLSATFPCEEDFAKGQLCLTIDECIKHVIGFNTKDGKNRKESLWMKEMGEYTSKHPEIKEQYGLIKEALILYADDFDKGCVLQEIRKIATHGDTKIDNLIKIHNLSHSEVLGYLAGWEKCMSPAANFAFTCFENECKRKINKRELSI